MRRHAFGAMAATVCSALLAGCGASPAVSTGAAAARTPLPSPTVVYDAGVADPDPKLLLEPTTSGNAALLNKARETNDVCNGMRQLDQLVEPPAQDADKLTAYGQGYFGVLQLISATKRIDDKRAQGRRDHLIAPPAEVVKALATERAEIYAFTQRIGYAQNLLHSGNNTQQEFLQRLAAAEYRLATGPYQAADGLLSQYVLQHCA
jgi:hypothetical protein